MSEKTAMTILVDARAAIDLASAWCRELERERDQLKAELANLQAEREPRDNGDGTVTAMLPVTFRVGNCGFPWVLVRVDGDPGNFRPAPQPPELVTWEAPLVDGEWTATDEYFRDSHGARWHWHLTGAIITGLAKPAKLGTYQFKGGVGTLIREES